MASISRFGRAISSGSSVSDRSFASSASVSSAVWSSRFAKSASAVPVVIKNSSNRVGRTIGYGTGFVNSGTRGHCALKPLEKPLAISEISVDAGHFSARARCPEPETSILRVARNLLLILLGVLLLSYLLPPLYRAGHPVSTLMAWRYLTGAPVSRQWIDFDAISPWLPRSVVASEDAKFCSHHGIDWDALRDVIDAAGDGEMVRGGSTSPSRWRKTCSCGRAAAWSARRWSSRSRCGSIWYCQSSGSWKSTSISPSSGRQASSAPKPAPCTPLAIRPQSCRR